MGLKQQEDITWLKVSDGKLRQKTDPSNPMAVKRHVDVDGGKDLYELVYTSCEGYLRDIRVQEHEDYGISYTLILVDPADGKKYGLAIGEPSRYFESLVACLPNIDFSQPLDVRPYMFTPAGQKSQSIGISFKQNKEKVKSIYKDFDEVSKKSVAKNGREKFDFSTVKDNKQKLTILKMELLLWLKDQLKPQLVRLKDFAENNAVPEQDSAPTKNTPATQKEADEAPKAAEKPAKGKAAKGKAAKGKAAKAQGKKKPLPY